MFFETDFLFEQSVPKSSRDFLLQNNHNNAPVMIRDPLEQHFSLRTAEQTTNLEAEEDTIYDLEQYGFAETTLGNQLHEEDTPHITPVSATEATGNDSLTQTETVEMPQEVSVPEKSASSSADLNVSNQRDVSSDSTSQTTDNIVSSSEIQLGRGHRQKALPSKGLKLCFCRNEYTFSSQIPSLYICRLLGVLKYTLSVFSGHHTGI